MTVHMAKDRAAKDPVDLALRQRGRASVDFITLLRSAGRDVVAAATEAMETIVPDPSVLPEDLEARFRKVEAALVNEPSYRTQKLTHEYHARMHGVVAREAFEQVRDLVEGKLRCLDDGPATLTLDPDFHAPDYWSGVDIHRTLGGWDGHEFQGFIHSEIIHKKMVAYMFGDLYGQRRDVAALAPNSSYERILDMGCSTGYFTVALAQLYPEARITGVDLSPRTLEQAHRLANANGWAWRLYQCAAEKTPFASGSFDLVTSYIMLHEMPEAAIVDLMGEAFRLLEPGGDLLFADVTRFSDMDRLQEWKADTAARFGGEPHWRASASLDLAALAASAGFIDAKTQSLGPNRYPHVLHARKA